MQGDQPAEKAAVPGVKLFTRGAKDFLCSLSFYEGRIDIMLTYGEFIATVALLVSIVRLVLDIVKYSNEHKKK